MMRGGRFVHKSNIKAGFHYRGSGIEQTIIKNIFGKGLHDVLNLVGCQQNGIIFKSINNRECAQFIDTIFLCMYHLWINDSR